MKLTIRHRCSTAIVLGDTADALRATLDDAQVVVTLLGDPEEPGGERRCACADSGPLGGSHRVRRDRR